MVDQKKQFVAKIESSEGDAETLAVADAKLLAYGLEITHNPQWFDRNPGGYSNSRIGKYLGSQACAMSCKMELKGSGTATTEPEWAKVLKACATRFSTLKSITIGAVTSGPFQHGEIISGGTSLATARVIIATANGTTTLYFVQITGAFQNGEILTGGTSGATATTGSTASSVGLVVEPLSYYGTNVPSLTAAGYNDGQREILRGCRGNFKLDAPKVGEPVMIDVPLSGLFSSLADGAQLANVTPDSIKAPRFFNTGFTVDGYAAKISQFDFDSQNVLAPAEDAGAAGINGILSYIVSDRNPIASFTVVFPLVAAYDFYGKMYAETELPINWTLGSTTGNKIQFYAPKFQITGIEKVSINGMRNIKISGQLNGAQYPGDTEYAMLLL
jgi:hypothetical protein